MLANGIRWHVGAKLVLIPTVIGWLLLNPVFGQKLRFLHSEIVRELPIAAGATDIAVFSDGRPAILYEDLLDTVVFSSGLRYAVRTGQGRWSVQTLVSAYNVFTYAPTAVAAGRTCYLFWINDGLNQGPSVYWARARADTLSTAHVLVDTTFGAHIGATRFSGRIVVGAFELHRGTGWGYRLFSIQGSAVASVEFPYSKRWKRVVLRPAGKRFLYAAGCCTVSPCVARTESNLRDWHAIPLPTSERAEGLRIGPLGERVLVFWELGEHGRLFPNVLRWLVIDQSEQTHGPFTLYRVVPSTVLFPPTVVEYRDRWLLLVLEAARFRDRELSAYYAIFDGDHWSEFRPFVPDSSFGVANVSAAVDETGLIRFAYSGGDGLKHILGYATARVEFPSSVPAAAHETPGAFRLQAPYPNPFNGTTEFRFSLARPGEATLHVVDVRGRVVRHFDFASPSPGPHTIRWDGRDDGGRPLPSGVYIVRLEAGGLVTTRKVVLVR